MFESSAKSFYLSLYLSPSFILSRARVLAPKALNHTLKLVIVDKATILLME
jgi:hypothetical protein